MDENAVYATPRHVTSLDDCYFYHTMEIPGHGVVTGDWDLRKDIDGYLGHTDFQGQRVLDVGAASGYLSLSMEQRGATVVSLDVGPDFVFDVVPFRGIDREAINNGFVQTQYRVQNGYWLAHRAFGSKNRAYYGSAYAIPSALGMFDIGVMGSMLLHNANPVAIIDQVAQRVTKKLVIADLYHEEIPGNTLPTVQFYPTAENQIFHTWWRFSERFFVEVLKVVGFPRVTTTHTTQYWKGQPFRLHTVVGEH